MSWLLIIFLFYVLGTSAPVESTRHVAEDFVTITGQQSIRDICGQTAHPEFCVNIFIHDPRSKTDDLTVLGRVAADATKQKLATVDNKVKVLAAGNKDRALKPVLEECIGLYDASNAQIERVNVLLSRGDYETFKDLGEVIVVRAGHCEEQFTTRKLPSPLTADNSEVGDYGNVIEVVGMMLMKKA